MEGSLSYLYPTIILAPSLMPDPPVGPLTEGFGGLNLPLGGKNGYHGVRGGQGSKRDRYQGCTPRKTHFTKLYDTAHEAAINLALLKRDLEDDSLDEDEKKLRKPRSDKVSRIALPTGCAT